MKEENPCATWHNFASEVPTHFIRGAKRSRLVFVITTECIYRTLPRCAKLSQSNKMGVRLSVETLRNDAETLPVRRISLPRTLHRQWKGGFHCLFYPKTNAVAQPHYFRYPWRLNDGFNVPYGARCKAYTGTDAQRREPWQLAP